MARPSEFSQEIANAICERLVGGESLRKITDDDAMPCASTVFKWLRENDEFSQQYAHAREAQADTLADEIVGISDGETNEADPQRDRLRVDARKWVAAKLKPKKYGEKIDVTSGGEKIAVDDVTRATRLAAIFNEIEKRNAAD